MVVVQRELRGLREQFQVIQGQKAPAVDDGGPLGLKGDGDPRAREVRRGEAHLAEVGGVADPDYAGGQARSSDTREKLGQNVGQREAVHRVVQATAEGW